MHKEGKEDVVGLMNVWMSGVYADYALRQIMSLPQLDLHEAEA